MLVSITLCSAFPIHTWDSDVLFVPPPEEEEGE